MKENYCNDIIYENDFEFEGKANKLFDQDEKLKDFSEGIEHDDLFPDTYENYEDEYEMEEFLENLEYEDIYPTLENHEEENHEDKYEDEYDYESLERSPLVKAAKKRFDNRKEELDSKYIYLYDVIERLVNLNLTDEFVINDLQELIDILQNEINEGGIYNLKKEDTDSLIEDLKLFRDDYVLQLDSDDSYLDSSIKFKHYIIEKYFVNRQREYNKNRDNKKAILKLFRSNEYSNGEIKEIDIAKKVGVSFEEVCKIIAKERKKR